MKLSLQIRRKALYITFFAEVHGGTRKYASQNAVYLRSMYGTRPE